jgi:hypothetical protein
MNDKLIMMWKEMLAIELKISSRNMFGGTEEGRENSA